MRLFGHAMLRASFAALLSTAAALAKHPAVLRQPTCASATHTQCRTAMAAPTMLISLTPRVTAICQHAASPMRRLEPLRMQEAPFWENVVRFMRFGVTSVTGLIAGMLSPFGAFLRTPTLTAIGATLLLGFLAFLYLTLQAMQSNIEMPITEAPIKYEGTVVRSEAPADPSMKKMLQDIYGE